MVNLADDGAFAAGAGTENPVAHGDVRRGFGSKSGEWQEEQQKETGHGVLGGLGRPCGFLMFQVSYTTKILATARLADSVFMPLGSCCRYAKNFAALSPTPPPRGEVFLLDEAGNDAAWQVFVVYEGDS